LSGLASGAGRGLSGVGSALGKTVAGAAKVAATAITAATGAATAFAGSAVAAGTAFDQAMGGVAATMGKEVDEMNAEVGSVDTSFGHFEGTLRDFAKFMGTNTTFSATQAAQALNYMALAGYKTQDSMEMLPAVLDMAAAGAMDLARASDMITDTQSALGLSFDRTHQMVNEFAKAASSGNTSVEQLGEAFLRVGGLAKNLNGGMVTLSDGTTATIDGVQEMEIALTAMANAGVKGAEAGTHMRNMLMKLSNPTKKGNEAIAKYTQGIFDAEGNMRSLSDVFGDLQASFSGITQAEKLKAIADLFNARDIASAESLLAAVEGTYVKIGDEILSIGSAQEKYGDAIYDSSAGDAASEMSKTKLDNLAGDVTLFKSALESAQIEINDKLSPYMRDFVQLATTGLQDVTKGFTSGGLTGAMEALGPFLSSLTEKVVEVLPTLIEAGTELLGALGQGLIDNADIIWNAMVQVGGMLKDKFKEMLKSAANSLSDADGKEMGSAIAEFIRGAFDDVGEFVSLGMKIIGELIRVISEAAPEIAPAIVEVMNSVGEAISESIDFSKILGSFQKLDGSKIGEDISKALATAAENISDLADVGFKIVAELVRAIGEAAPGLLEGAVTLITTLANDIVENLPMLIQSAVTAIIDFATALSNPDNLTSLLDSALAIVMALADGIIQALPTLIEALPQIIENILLFITQNLPKIMVAGVQLVGKLTLGIIRAIPSLIGALPKVMGAFTEGILSYAASIINSGKNMIEWVKEGFLSLDPLQWGKDLIDNFVNGIMSGIDKIKEAAGNVGNAIKDFLGFSEPEKGPLSNFHTFAPDMIDLFTQGMEDNMDKVENAANDMALAIKPDMSDVDAIEVRTAEIPDRAKGGLSDKLVAEIEKLIESFNAQQETVIPIYIGNKMIDELVLDANRRIRVKSGGFANV
jgi:TP901 family phage tail tape measure protein